MPDTRTLRQKLEAMAKQTASPEEASIAQRKLLLKGELRETYAGIFASDDAAGPCPGCSHGADRHAGGTCYGMNSFCDCRWHILSEGNTFRLPKGWHSVSDMLGRSYE